MLASTIAGSFFHRTEARALVADLVTKTLRSNDGDLIADTLVGLKVEGEFGVVAFDNDLGRFLDGLRANATLEDALACKTDTGQ